jgi:lipoprotein-anchoring transpeptidase ErfK/SrfK
MPGLTVATLVCALHAAPSATPAVTFAAQPGVLYVPIRPAAAALGLPVEWSPESGATVGGQPVDESTVRKASDGTRLVPLRSLLTEGMTAVSEPKGKATRVVWEAGEAVFEAAEKFVEISIAEQRMRAWQGSYLVLETPVSTGRRGYATPRGKFKAHTRERMRYSRLYDNSPMPWSVQINGHIFIHGYKSVPRHPASHGCIRMPLWGENPARKFWEWVDIGTPVHVVAQFTRPEAAPEATEPGA